MYDFLYSGFFSLVKDVGRKKEKQEKKDKNKGNPPELEARAGEVMLFPSRAGDRHAWPTATVNFRNSGD